MDSFSTRIYHWYHKNKRDLPWRSTTDPYKIWISEVILQQTRVAQGTKYYLKFTKTFPKVDNLAAAPEEEVLKLWQGLGYYSRARNMHAAAKTIVTKYGSVFPDKYEDIIQLKGIGPYTAAAIASIAFNLPYPTVDGNIYRVLARFYGVELPIDSNAGKKTFQQLAEEIINRTDPGMHNQALMEFGALQCIPKSPSCTSCPLVDSCYAFINKLIDHLPVKEKKTKQTNRYFTYYLIDDGKNIYLNKRTQNDIWKNLNELPLVEHKHDLSDDEILRKKIPFLPKDGITVKQLSKVKKHILSHQIIYANLIYVEVEQDVHITPPLFRVNKKDISKFAVPRLVEQFFEDLSLV